MRQPSVIAIDGPAGAGKSTLGALLAARLGYFYFDTGVMYRALALAAIRAGVDLDDPAAMERLAHDVQIEVGPPTRNDGRQYDVRLGDEDVTWAIRDPAVEASVSRASRFPAVRAELRHRQQEIGRRGKVVMVGRDIGTVVMPDAELKIFLGASLEERARRRAGEREARHEPARLDEVRAEIARRDELDRHVMQPAADAVLLDTDGLTPEQEVDWITAYIARQP